MVEINLRERLAHPFALFPDLPLNRRLGRRSSDPIEDRQANQGRHLIDNGRAIRRRDDGSIATPLYYPSMMLDLSDDEAAALARLLRSTLDENRYPLSPRLAPLRAILAKLDPPKPRPEPPPPLKAYDAPAAGRRRRRG
jgi:hypothetical protein